MKLVIIGFILLIVIISCGTLGYMMIEDWGFLDSLYMTVITITTTGFAEVRPLSPSGRLLTLGLIVVGVGAIAYIGGRTVQVLVEYQLFRRRRLNKKVSALKNHYIVCGYGRLGRPICSELTATNSPFVVIEKDQDKIEEMTERGYLFVNGDATQDEILLKAGIKNSKGLVAVLATDADNVYITLTTRVLNPEIFVVTRAIDEEAERKLVRAGANRVVKPYEIGAFRMAHLLTRPAVADFIDIVANKKADGIDLNLEEIMIDATSPLVNKTLQESLIRQNLNIIVVAIFRKDGEFIYNPTSSVKLIAGDRLVAIGQVSDLEKLNELCNY